MRPGDAVEENHALVTLFASWKCKSLVAKRNEENKELDACPATKRKPAVVCQTVAK